MIKEMLDRPSSDQSYPSLQSSAPYPSAAYLFALRIGREIRRQTKRKLNLAPTAIGSAIARLWRDGDAYTFIHDAIEEVRRLDENRGLPQSVAPIEETLPKPDVDLAHPRIKRVRIENFKSLESIEFNMKAQMPEVAVAMSVPNEFSDVPDAPCLLILGENATGKSSILEAIALTCIPTDLRNQLQESPSDLLMDPEYMGSAGHKPINRGSIEVEFYNDAPTLKLVLDRTNGIFGDDTDAHHPLVFAYGAHRLFDREQRDDVVRHIDTLFRRDQVISNPEPWLIELSRNSPESLNEVVSALRHIIQIDGHFRNIEVGHDQDGKEYCAINIERKNPPGMLRQRLGVVSSGYRAVLAVVCDIFSRLFELSKNDHRAARHARAIILIDEIEAHLHPRWKMQIVSGLRRALPRSTFILTSHDPLCLRGMFAGEVMMLNRFRNRDGAVESSMNEIVEQISDFPNIENLTIDQLLTSDIFQLFTTDDRRIETAFAEVPAILKKEEEFLRTREERWRLSEREQTILRSFRNEISNGLPYGKTEVSRLVQEAVAEYVASRRERDKSSNDDKRQRAKDAVKSYLGDLLG
ncbi:AAA family ATPase (plasmid) [Mesorhizobium sp. AR10]|uniref:AAA family ATPase n=1 Tax=Mesorhizobium sp. AR10 TaxID=2865839 RepID=UPI00215E4908|nr:AAA family ATPase [Mesorhizobium sp. AR10]UVK35739.1 AAA family ATPase [Mesorhizobium sp. AR10]